MVRPIRLAVSILGFALLASAGQTAGACAPRHAADAQLDASTWCCHLVPDGSVYAFLADHRQRLFPSELFADLTRQGGGHPSVPAQMVATVMFLQALEGLSDREAISAFTAAVSAFRAHHLPWEEAEADCLWARALAANRPAEATGHLQAATGLYRELDASPRWTAWATGLAGSRPA